MRNPLIFSRLTYRYKRTFTITRHNCWLRTAQTFDDVSQTGLNNSWFANSPRVQKHSPVLSVPTVYAYSIYSSCWVNIDELLGDRYKSFYQAGQSVRELAEAVFIHRAEIRPIFKWTRMNPLWIKCRKNTGLRNRLFSASWERKKTNA